MNLTYVKDSEMYDLVYFVGQQLSGWFLRDKFNLFCLSFGGVLLTSFDNLNESLKMAGIIAAIVGVIAGAMVKVFQAVQEYHKTQISNIDAQKEKLELRRQLWELEKDMSGK